MRFLCFVGACALFAGCQEYEFEGVKQDTAVEPVPTLQEPDVPEPEPELVDTAITQPEPEPPVAVCSATPNPVAPPFESADWIGGRSYDPGGYDLIDYQWRLSSKPAGSAVTMPPSTGGTNREGFVPDLAGDYVGELIDGRASSTVLILDIDETSPTYLEVLARVVNQ